MSDESGSSKMAFFLAGLGIGAILALLFAPKSGEETRQYITGKAGEGKDFVASRSKEPWYPSRKKNCPRLSKPGGRLTRRKNRKRARQRADG